MVKRRHVYHVAGYDPIDAGAQHRRFTRQLEVFQRTWNVDAALSELELAESESRAWWQVQARGANWQVEAVHEVLLWDDIVRGDFKRTLPARLLDAARVYLDYIVTGTMFRYVAANPRYATFFLYPIVALALFAAAGWFVARLLTGLIGLEGLGAAAVGLVAGLAVFYGLLQWPGRRWRVEQLLDDWICAHGDIGVAVPIRIPLKATIGPVQPQQQAHGAEIFRHEVPGIFRIERPDRLDREAGTTIPPVFEPQQPALQRMGVFQRNG